MSAEQDNTPDYSLLTPEEIEAIGADPSPEELATMRQAEEAKDLPDDDDDGEGSNAEESAEATKADKEPAKNDDAPAPADDQKPVDAPIYESTLPDDFEQQREALKAERAELKQKYKDGEIDFDEYEEQRDALADREKSLDRAETKAEIAQDMSAQSERRTWLQTVNSFFDASVSAGIDYRADDAKRADLDLYVKTLANNPANSDKPGEWFLKTADKMVRAQYDLSQATESQKPNGKPSRKAPIDQIPQTLAHVPGGDDASEADSKYADLDKLDGLALETALAKLTPDQRAEYLGGA